MHPMLPDFAPAIVWTSSQATSFKLGAPARIQVLASGRDTTKADLLTRVSTVNNYTPAGGQLGTCVYLNSWNV